MNRLNLSGLVTALVLLFAWVALSPQLMGQNNAPSKQEPNAQQQQQQPGAQGQQPAAKAFNGTIVKDGDRLVLKDMDGNMTYQLDDQKKVRKYEGKSVKITGSLDASSNTIHVENIEASS
jgi:uncharacterized protein YdeI (BOF family)